MKFLEKTTTVIYAIMFTIILSLLFFFSSMDYYLKREFLIPNIIVLLVVIIPVFLIYYFLFKKKEDISLKKYRNTLIIIFVITFILQLILTVSIYFYTDWDVKIIRDIVDSFIKTGSLKDNYYLTLYPNNLLLTMILVGIKSIPFLGSNYLFLLAIDCLLVNLAGLFTSLTIKNVSSKKAALACYIIMLPLILLSPWIVIPYTDTFAILFPILVLYLYTKKNRRIYDYYLIGLFSALGYYIKPTVIIVLIAIVIVEVFSRLHFIFKKDIIKKKVKKYLGIFALLLFGMLTSFSINKLSYKVLNFEQVTYVEPFTFIHYLAMGQNDETLGAYSEKDINESAYLGKKHDLEKFYDRLTTRTFGEQVSFFAKKTLLNFNDGSFSWAKDGIFFYKKVDAPSTFAEEIREIYYSGGKYYDQFLQFSQILWLIVLTFCPFIIKRKNNKNELVIMLSIIGITLFLTIFEPRTRYLYCYSPIFVVAFVLGISNLKSTLKRVSIKSRKKETV